MGNVYRAAEAVLLVNGVKIAPVGELPVVPVIRVSWYAKDNTIVAKAFRGDALAYRTEHELPRSAAPALFWLVIGALSREVSENAH